MIENVLWFHIPVDDVVVVDVVDALHYLPDDHLGKPFLDRLVLFEFEEIVKLS